MIPVVDTSNLVDDTGSLIPFGAKAPLSFHELVRLVESGVIENAAIGQVNGASIDLRLGRKLLIEGRSEGYKYPGHPDVVSLKNRDSLKTVEHDLLHDGPYILKPGEFILASTVEVFHLPNDIVGLLQIVSSAARVGCAHLNAGLCSPLWNGSSLTLELRNMTTYHYLKLEYGITIGQIVLFNCYPVPERGGYRQRGSYNNDKTVSGAKKPVVQPQEGETDGN